ASGGAALRACQERRFGAITLDLLLPDMIGLDVLRGVRATGENREVPIILATVAADRGIADGFAVHDCLSKPLDADALRASLRRAGLAPDKKKTVLAVDDDAGSRRLMAAMLGQLGFTAVGADGGENGLRAAREAPPAAVVLDLAMPGMDGFEFLDRFRRLPGCRRVPVVIWTAKDLSGHELGSLRASAQAIVPKGRDGGGSLLDELKAFLNGSPAGDEMKAR